MVLRYQARPTCSEFNRTTFQSVECLSIAGRFRKTFADRSGNKLE